MIFFLFTTFLNNSLKCKQGRWYNNKKIVVSHFACCIQKVPLWPPVLLLCVSQCVCTSSKHGSHAWRLPNTRSTQIVTMRLLLSWSPSPNWRAKWEEGWCRDTWSWVLDPEEERRRWVLCCLILIVTENISRGHLRGCAGSPEVSRSCGLTWWMLYSLISSLWWD